MPIVFKDWFWNKLPLYFKRQDTYLDINKEGITQRYLRNFGMELDSGIKPFIDNFINLLDPKKCPTALLPMLSFNLGLPPNLNNTEATYRKMLEYAVAIYRIKGTALSYKAMFNLLGLDIQVIEDEPPHPSAYDDAAVFYDSGAIYDQPIYCSTYAIAYNNPTNTLVDPSIIALAQAAICLLEPINAKFRGFIRRLDISEFYPLDVVETTNLPPTVIPSGEFSDDFDTDNSYD